MSLILLIKSAFLIKNVIFEVLISPVLIATLSCKISDENHV